MIRGSTESWPPVAIGIRGGSAGLKVKLAAAASEGLCPCEGALPAEICDDECQDLELGGLEGLQLLLTAEKSCHLRLLRRPLRLEGRTCRRVTLHPQISRGWYWLASRRAGA